MKVTIVGGTGPVGRLVSPILHERGHRVTITGRAVPPQPSPGVRGARLDLATGEGISEAMTGADSVVLLASDPRRAREIDVAGTARLLKQVGDRHLVYLSIVGVDRHPLPYYRSKLAAERSIEQAGCRHTILRATQFHDFVMYRVDQMTHSPIARVPMGYVYQPIDIDEVATELAILVEGPPRGRAPDLAGPEILGIAHLARTYMSVKGIERPLISYPKPGPVARAFRQGLHTNPERAVGKVTWADHLQRRFANR